MKVTVNKKPKSVLEMTVVVPNDKVKLTYDVLFKDIVANAEIKGFRKGQAPESVVKEKTDISKLYGELINNLLQLYYPQALKEQKISPIANPRVEIKEFDIDKDFEFTATIATRPDVKVGDYKKEIKKIYEQKTKDLKKENQEKIKKGEEIEHDHAHLGADDVITGMISVTKVELPDILIDEETDRMLARLVEQAQNVGLTLDQYLQSQNKSEEDLRSDYQEIAERNLKAELALSHVISNENVEVKDEEVDEMINMSGDPSVKESMESVQQRLFIKSILLKNKLITGIIKEIEGDNHHVNEK